MLLANAVRTTKVKAFTWALFDGVEFELCYQGRKQTTGILKEAYVTVEDNGKVRQEFDAEVFSKGFVSKTVVGWKGLKLRHLADWMLLADDQDLEQEVEFSHENALWLYENWKPFEDWINSVIHNIDRFRDKPSEPVVKGSEGVSDETVGSGDLVG